MRLDFIVSGKVQGKARPRLNGNGSVYTPEKTVNYQNEIRSAFLKAKDGIDTVYPLQGTVEVKIYCAVELPKSKQKQSKHGYLATCKPDTDNVAKVVMDALNGLAYKDDMQVASLVVERRYHELAPYIHVSVCNRL